MTDQEINRAVAESVSASFGCSVVIEKDYCNDLNALHEVEKTLTDDNRDPYLRELQILTQTWDHVDAEGDEVEWFWELATATARQRAEAYLRTIGKWRDA